MDALAVRTTIVGIRNAKEEVAVLSGVERVREVGVAVREAAVEDFAAHEIVLRITLAVAEREGSVGILMEAHHDAGAVDGFRVIDGFDVHVPADFALRVENGVLRVVVPFERAAGGVVPDHAALLRSGREEVVDEVEAVLEFGIDLHDLGLEHVVVLSHRAVHRGVDRRGVHRVDLFLNARFLAVVDIGVAHLDLVVVVGIEAEHRNAGIGAKGLVAHLVGDFLAARLRDDAHGSVLELIAAVLDDGRERCNLVGVDDDFADLARSNVLHGRAGAAAACHDGRREAEARDEGEREGDRRKLGREGHQSILLSTQCGIVAKLMQLIFSIRSKRVNRFLFFGYWWLPTANDLIWNTQFSENEKSTGPRRTHLLQDPL